MNNSPTTIAGNITREPEFVTLPSGQSKLSFSVAASHRFQKSGEWTEETSFFNVVVWRKTAEQARKLLQKGMGVVVTGRLDQRSWENDEGQRRSAIEIVADNIGINVWALDSVTPRQKSGTYAKVPDSGPTEAPF